MQQKLNVPVEESKLKLEKIYTQNQNGLNEFNQKLIHSEEEFEKELQKRRISSHQVSSDIDFNKSSLIIIDLGMRRSGGYSGILENPKIENQNLVVDLTLFSPRPNDLLMMALTYSTLIYKVNTTKIKQLIVNPK
ncbi:hypothetical protein MSHRCOH1_04470 [Candidatus Ornithobacterium hominis]|uniref:hypothetical protein n=1 Tax=Candidatus Ornithobacterium hominis TaxID=2497989 RepID=UPI0024BC5AB8|nr:hypothetical protein [Candidatus Ornithobacterium hominis]CAI9429446.1 hypothetical protein MSHRCOH1_04470 [Candidatus Ornithobacterium hominis]